jgi:hypothetical protein
MRIGIDFDNTIACYDGVFHTAAFQRGLIPADLGASKNEVRDYLNNSGRSEDFTELQGYVYGARMDLVAPYVGFGAFLAQATGSKNELFIVSHKTKNPMLGPKYDMHTAARGFLEAQGFIGNNGVQPKNIYFEQTKEDKVARANKLAVDVFIDDLPEILSMRGFPAGLRPILFDPDGRYPDDKAFERHTAWSAIATALFGG